MAQGIKPIRRVVTGNDAQGRSKVLDDSAALNVNANAFKKGTGMTDIWLFDQCPAPISGERDDGDIPFHFEPPETGGRLRVVQSEPKPADYDAAKDTFITAEHPPRRTEGGTWERGRQNLYTTRIHKSETVDYGILLSGERVLLTVPTRFLRDWVAAHYADRIRVLWRRVNPKVNGVALNVTPVPATT